MADFRFFINRQGPRGPQGLKGEKGDPGNTFTVSEGVNTPTEYTLIFDGGDGNQFETDNLRNPIVDRGGTYVRYDRDNVVQYIGEPDMAVIDGTPGIVNLAGKDTVTPNASDAVAYELLEKTVDELNTALENLDGRLDDAQGDITQAQGDIVGLDNRVTTNEGAITSLQSGKADKSTTYTKTEVNNALAGKANTVHTHTVSQITNAGALASQNTVDYQTQVTNKPTIPTVGNGTITLTQGGVTKGTFTTNQSGNSTIDLDAGGTSSFTEGNAINISNNTISVKYDGTTIGLNASGQLQSLVEEPDMTQYYTKSQVDNLIPDVSHMVTDNTTQSITGTKTYGAGNLKINDLCLSDGTKVIEDKGTYVYVGSPGVTTKIKSNNTKLYFNGQSGVDEEIAKVSQLPGAATSSSLGLVQPDGTTIAVDANGVISANIPTPETVDQTYDASSTHAQSGVAIAGAGFLTSVPTATTSNLGLVQPDGTSITINDGVISAAGSAPSNMVTTDTAQTITSNKTFSGTNGLYFGTSYPFRVYNDSGVLKITQPSSGNDTYTGMDSVQFLCRGTYGLISVLSANSSQSGASNYYSANGGYNGYNFGVNQSGNNYYNQITTYNKSGNVDPKIYRNVVTNDRISLGTNFLLEKDMLDGTTIQYNSTSGKVEVIGGGGGSSGVEIDEVESPLIIKSVSAKTYSAPVTNNQLQCIYHNSPDNIALSESTDYYLEYRLDNGLNCLVSFLQKGNSQSSYKCLGLQAGYYNNSIFVPVFSITDGTGNAIMRYYDYIKASSGDYSFYSTGYEKPNVRVSYDSTAGTLVIGDTTNTSTGYSGGSSINVDVDTQVEMAKVNVIRLFAWTRYQSYADGRYIDVSNYTCYNPSRNDYDFHSVVGGSGNTSTLMANFFADSTQQPISGTPKSVLTSSISSDHPMPGDVFDFVTLGASGAEYTAYDTGWFILGFTASANNQYLEVTKPIANRLGVSLTTTVFKSQVYGSTANYIGTSIPVKKGDKITVNYNTGGTNNIIFVPAAS